MRKRETKMEFYSPLGELMSKLLGKKQACGYRYEVGLHALQAVGPFSL